MINRKFFLKSEKGTKVYDVFRWFRSVFVVLSLVFCLGMTPLLIYLQVTFNNLQVEKYKQIINSADCILIYALRSSANGKNYRLHLW